MKDLDKEIYNMKFFCLQLNKYTKKMFDIMKANTKFLQITEQLLPEKFLPVVTASIMASVTKHGIEEKIDHKFTPLGDQQAEYQVRRLTYRFPDFTDTINHNTPDFFLNLFNKTQIDEAIVKIVVDKGILGGSDGGI